MAMGESWKAMFTPASEKAAIAGISWKWSRNKTKRAAIIRALNKTRALLPPSWPAFKVSAEAWPIG